MAIYITGGSGYIGNHLVHALSQHAEELIVIDNNSGKNQYSRKNKVKYIDISLHQSGAREILVHEFLKTKNNCVVHLAGLKSVENSERNPDLYTHINLNATINLLSAMEQGSVDKFIFSSTAAVYGDNIRLADETSLTNPISQYGKVKLKEEELIKKAGLNSLSSYAILRFFNVIGAQSASMRELSGGNIFPQLTRAIERRETFRIFGNSYPTLDGTCVRDYVDVRDLVIAISKTINLLNHGPVGVLNLGSGIETSVLQLVKKVMDVKSFNYEIAPARNGDISTLISDVTKAKSVLNWIPNYSIEDSVNSVFRP